MIEPTIGRIVWFQAYNPSTMTHGGPFAAIITGVNGGRSVNLAVFERAGLSKGVIDVPLVQDGEPAPQARSYAEWMPYQKGQAAKTEALEAQVERAATLQTRTDDAGIEAELIAKGKTAPRVTQADLRANIAHTEIVKHIAPSGQVLRWAVLTTRSGFAVTGRPSASVSPENDDAEVGEKVAVENATQELWPLMGYALKERLSRNV